MSTSAALESDGQQSSKPEEAARSEGHTPWYYRFRSRIIVALVVPLVFWPFERLPLDLLSGISGGALLALGVALRVWSIRQIGGAARKRKNAKAARLVTWGPFGWSRNPIYIANMLVLAGFSVLAGLAWLAPLLIALMWTQYHFTVRFEEGFLEDSFGDEFRRFREETPRWIGLSRRRAAPEGFTPYPWKKLIRRERSFLLAQIPGGLAVILVLRIALAV